jgi:putative FmdB family regulatory protein
MPIYEYQCKECNDREEVIQKISDAPLTQCAKCGGEMKKLHSSPAIQFKGSGFYKTDYPSASSKSDSSKGDSSKGESSKGDSSKSDSSKGESSKSESKSSESKSESTASTSTKSDSKSSD